MDSLRKLASQHAYLNYFINRTYSITIIKEIEEINKEMVDKDFIKDVTYLKKFVEDVNLGHKNHKTKDINFQNSHLYGIWHSMFKDITSKLIETPAIEHGLFFFNNVYSDSLYTARASCLTFSDFRRDIIQNLQKILVFTVGPYIHYAENFYTIDRIEKEKIKNGKTLLVFPTHSTHISKSHVNTKLYCESINKIAKNYNTIFICTYWWNINDVLIKRFETEGYNIVSAGYSLDVSFLSRLKTIFSLSDFVVGDSIGTHIGYSIHLKKPFSYLDINSKVYPLKEGEIKFIEFRRNIEEDIKNIFKDSKNITPEQEDICNKYWGLDQVKTKEELLAISLITQEIVCTSKGLTFNYLTTAYHLLKKYETEDALKYSLLKDALRGI